LFHISLFFLSFYSILLSVFQLPLFCISFYCTHL
jgi:hypothetical protein